MSDNKVWTAEEIKELLLNNDRAVARGVLAIYARQTSSERADGVTKVLNGVGFNGADSRYLSYCANWLRTHSALTGRHLSKARRMMLKYSGQLASIANNKVAEKPTQAVAPEASTAMQKGSW